MSEFARHTTRFICYWLAFFSIGAAHWLREYFGPVTLPQLLYHLHFSIGVLADTDSAFLISFLLECVLGATLIAALLISIDLYVDTRVFVRALMTLRMRPSSALRKTTDYLRSLLPLLLLMVGVLTIFFSLSMSGYLRVLFSPDRFVTRYVPPATIELHATKPKNLVLIYVESLEATYGDQDVFGEDLIAELNALQGQTFGSYLQTPGTNWTMAGIVATQCGIPLQLVEWEHATSKGRADFLPRATCLGDILRRFGYRNVFLGGANLSFAGKGNFLRSHGYDEAYGSTEWSRANPSRFEFSSWGMYDDDLLSMAKLRLLELARSGKPFNLTILTVDTHQPKGLYSKFCKDRGADSYAELIKCTSAQVSDFVAFATGHVLLKDTNIVIVGDHLSGPNPAYETLTIDPRRRIFNKFIAKEPLPKNRENIVAFDLLPTTLEFLGFEVDGNRLGLGCSAFFEGGEHCPIVSTEDAWLGEPALSATYRMLWAAK